MHKIRLTLQIRLSTGQRKTPDLEAYASKDFQSWHSRWQERIRKEKQDRTATLV